MLTARSVASRAGVSSRPTPMARAFTCSCSSQQHQQQPISAAQPLNALARRCLGAGLGAALGLTLLLAPQPAMAASSSLADVMRAEFGFVDSNKDGVVTKEELLSFTEQMSKDMDVAPVALDNIEFTERLFDLNADGKTTTDEFLVSLALDRAIDTDVGVVDEAVFQAFDGNKDGAVDMREWTNTLGDFGDNGRQTQEFIFHRVDLVSGENSGKLALDGFAPAFMQMRTAVLGF